MTTTPQQRLTQAVASIRRRWGSQAIEVAALLPPDNTSLSTGYASLDRLLEYGLPRGRMTELHGRPTSGMRSLAWSVLAQAQQRGRLVAWMDLAGTFDAEGAAACRVNVAHLLLIRPANLPEALAIVQALIATQEAEVIVVDSVDAFLIQHSDQRMLMDAVARWTPLLLQTHCTLLLLTTLHAATIADPLAGTAIAHAAAVRLHIERTGWIERDRDVVGYRAMVTVTKHRRGLPRASSTIAIDIPPL